MHRPFMLAFKAPGRAKKLGPSSRHPGCSLEPFLSRYMEIPSEGVKYFRLPWCVWRSLRHVRTAGNPQNDIVQHADIRENNA